MTWNRVLGVLLLAWLIVCLVGIFGMAAKATEADNACSAIGGHLEGYFDMRCVVP